MRRAGIPVAFGSDKALQAFHKSLKITRPLQPSGNMPPYTAAVLTDGELADIYAFLQSIPDPPDLEDVLPR